MTNICPINLFIFIKDKYLTHVYIYIYISMSNICLVFFMYQLLIFVLCFYIFISDKYLFRVILIFVLNMNISHNILFFLQNISHNIERNENQTIYTHEI